MTARLTSLVGIRPAEYVIDKANEKQTFYAIANEQKDKLPSPLLK